MTSPVSRARDFAQRLVSGSAAPAEKSLVNEPKQSSDGLDDVTSYWSEHNVTSHFHFSSREESLDFLAWRNDQYPGYIDLMPVVGHEGKRILDYGCGPGHDLVGFCHFSRGTRVTGADLSGPSLEEARGRLDLHGFSADLVQITSDDRLPFGDREFDLVHCSGVLHHTPDPLKILRDFNRVLGDNGSAQIMVYNYESIWTHLYVAYIKRIVEGLYGNLDIKSAFARTTDGENCPIAYPYTRPEFEEICRAAGFQVVQTGAAISLWELSLLPRRFEAMMDRRLRRESREFLNGLTFDARGVPYRRDSVAGIDLCFTIRKTQPVV
jgi:ubiquinone/menaquinone biosynthesis C-methylase UbiE